MKLSFLRFFDFINNESGSSSAPYRSRRRQPHLGSMRPPDNVGTPPADSRGTEAWQPICKPRFAAPRTPSAAHHCGQHFDAHPGSTIFTPGQHNLHTRAVQPFGQTVASDRRPFRPDRLDEQPNASGGVPLEQPAVSHGHPRQASRTQIPVFWPLAVSAGTPNRLGRHDPPDGYSKRPSRTRPAAASNSRAVEAKASRRLVTSVARGSESSAIQTDSTPPSVAARRAERSSNSAKSPS